MTAVFRAALAVLLLVATACTESGLTRGPGLFAAAVAEAEDVIAAFPPLCEALRTQGYETRKNTYSEATDASRRLAAAACPGDVDRLRNASAVEDAAATIPDDAVEVSFTRCAGTRTGFAATIELTNTAPRPVGVFGAVRNVVDEKISGRGAAFTVWSIAPGETVTRDVEAPAGGGSACTARFTVFAADGDVDGDASGIAPADGPTASDDPSVWVPALVAAEAEWWTSGEASADAPATTEDLRSTAYRGMVAHVTAGSRGEPPSGPVTVCSHRAHPDDPRRVTVVAIIDERLVFTAARRGADGGWRWLGAPASLGAPECPR